MQMTLWEIKNSYKTAKNKQKQIGILAELNDCSRKEIEDILQIYEKPVEVIEVKDHILVDNHNREIMDKLFARLDVLDKEIKDREEEYRKISIAIEVLGKIGA